MNWDDVFDVLLDGTDAQIESVKCPECTGGLTFAYFPITNSMFLQCASCGATIRSNGVEKVPNFALASAT